MQALIKQLQRRQVFKVATIYAVAAWPLVQIADLVVPAIGLPDSVMTLLLLVFLFGFPLALTFAWFFNFTANGIVLASSCAAHENKPQATLQTTLGVLSFIIVGFIGTLGTQYYLGDKSVLVQAPQVNTGKQFFGFSFL